ncbi:hypothetical protein DL95DRAFT_471937 [Leptodontidium sp. 2 PMI_412]|nr:hypothetical protein DL95DRAFT_471937 [Leptodontidium sp. 2 PMI_412]
MEVSEQLNPWVGLAKAWASPEPNQAIISIQKQDGDEAVIILIIPLAIPCIQPFTLYSDSKTTFETWLFANRGRRLALEEFYLNPAISPRGLVRSSLYFGIPHIFHRWRAQPSEGAETQVEVECFPLPKRRNFLEAGTLSEKSTDLARGEWSENPPGEVRSFLAKTCTVDLLPIEQARFSLFIPAITQRIEVVMVAYQLCQTILKNVLFRDIHRVITAISASSTQLATNYQRYEFLGNSILKFIVSTQLFVDHENWHEGYFSEEIHFAGKRTVSSKTLADVVEALIGAVFSDEGLFAARGCTHTFLPDIRTPSLVFGPGLDAEKFFSDIIESVFGAIFVDTGGTLADCQRFAERIEVMPYLRRIMADGIDVVHPKASLERLTGPDKIEYIVGFEESNNHVYQCSIKINNIEVVTVGECLTKEEAVMRAAEGAAKLISRTKPQATTSSQHM